MLKTSGIHTHTHTHMHVCECVCVFVCVCLLHLGESGGARLFAGRRRRPGKPHNCDHLSSPGLRFRVWVAELLGSRVEV